MEDRKILQLLFARAETALDALAQRFGYRLQQTAMNILGDARDAEEAVSDTYLALWNTIPPERPEPLAPYVYRVGRNTALKLLRRNTAQKRYGGYDLCLEELAGVLPGEELEKTVETRALGQAIDRFLDTLSKQNRILFLRRYWYGDSVKALAAALGMKESALSVRLLRIRNSLKDYLYKEGFWHEA